MDAVELDPAQELVLDLAARTRPLRARARLPAGMPDGARQPAARGQLERHRGAARGGRRDRADGGPVGLRKQLGLSQRPGAATGVMRRGMLLITALVVALGAFELEIRASTCSLPRGQRSWRRASARPVPDAPASDKQLHPFRGWSLRTKSKPQSPFGHEPARPAISSASPRPSTTTGTSTKPTLRSGSSVARSRSA